MISEALDIFRRNRRFEPRWFKFMRSTIAVFCLIGIVIYLGSLLIDLNRKETYLTSTRVERTSPNYNPHFPFPDYFKAGYTQNMSTWMPPYIEVKCGVESVLRNGSVRDDLYPGCTGLLDQLQDSEGQLVVYNYVNLTSPLYFMDYISCTQLPDPLPSYCNGGIYSFRMSFKLPPNVTISPYAGLKLEIQSENKGLSHNSSQIPQFPEVVYNIIPGQYLRIQLDYTENHDVAGNVFYTNTQSQTTAAVPLNSTEILERSVVYLFIWANTASYTVTYERYYHSWGELFGLVSGLYGGVASVFVLLFGATRFSPWGLIQTTILKRVLSGPLRDHLNPSDSIANSDTLLAERIPISIADNPLEEVVILRERLGKLELFLSSYVVDRELLDSDTEKKVDMASKTLLEDWNEKQEK